MKRSEFMMGGVDFKDLRASQIMEADVQVASPHHTWEQVASLMTHGRFGDVPVVDEGGRLLGIVTEHDLLKTFEDEDDVRKVTVGSIMTPGPTTISADAGFGEIVDLLLSNHLIRVPVVRDDKVVGIVARRDILFAFLQAAQKPPGTL